MRVLLVDVETTGLEKTSAVVEVGAVLLDTTLRAVLWSFGAIVPSVSANPCAAINGISDDLLGSARYTFSDRDVLEPLRWLLSNAVIDAVAAHNAEFDRPFVEAAVGAIDLRWFCTQVDLAYPRAGNSSRKLGHLAVDHGVPVGTTHRALADCLLLADIMRTMPDLDARVTEALKPRGYFQALVGYERNALAKERGYLWHGKRKVWWRRLPLDTPTLPTEDRPFTIERLENFTP